MREVPVSMTARQPWGHQSVVRSPKDNLRSEVIPVFLQPPCRLSFIAIYRSAPGWEKPYIFPKGSPPGLLP